MRKILALLLSVLLLVAGLPIAASAVDVVAGAATELDGKYYSLGEVLYENDFENTTHEVLPEGWESGRPSYVWKGSGGDPSVKAWHSGDGKKYLSFGASGSDGMAFSPVINTRNYMFEADIIVNTGYIGVANNMPGGLNGSTGAVINRFSPSGNTNPNITFSKGDAGVAEKAITLPTENPASGETVKVKIISFEGMSYFYYNGTLVSSYNNAYLESTTDYVGFFGCNSWFNVDNVKITALNVEKAPAVKTAAEKYAENTLGAELGDILLEEDFSKGSMTAAVSGNHAISSDYTQTSGWEFYDTAKIVWHANAGSCVVKGGYLQFYCSYGDSAVVLPQLNASDYIFTAKVKRGGWGHATGGSAALVTDIANDAANSTTYQRFAFNFNGAAEPHTLTTTFVKTNAGEKAYTLTGTYDMANYVNFTVISYKGMKYFFIEEELVATVASILNEGERLGFYVGTKDIAVDDIVVKKLNTPPPAEEKFAATLGAEIGDVLLEEHFDKGDMDKVTGNTTISSDYTQMPGWEFIDTAPFIWHNNAASFRILNGAAQFWCSSGNAALILPQLNESNYVFTAKIKRSGWGSTGASAGIITDLCANLDASTPQIRLVGYYDSATDDGAFPFTKVITKSNGGADREITLENTYDLVSYVDFGVVSYEGTNYYFLNGDYIGSATKVGGEGERLGFYLSTADITVDDVYVKELNGPTLDVVEIAGINAVKVAENVEDNNAYKVSFTMNADVAANIGFFTADADNAESVGYVEGENKTICTVAAEATQGEAIITVDKKGSTADAVGSDLYMYVIDGDVSALNISEASAVLLTDVTGEKPLLTQAGISMLEGVAENNNQALRYYFNYDSINGNDIIIDGEVYTVKSRGFLVTNGTANANAQITRSAANGTTVKDINVTKLANCWNAVANNDALNSSELTYSIHVTGFKPVNGTYNNTSRLYVKGYVVVEVNGVEYTLYSEELNMTVSEVANLV